MIWKHTSVWANCKNIASQLWPMLKMLLQYLAHSWKQQVKKWNNRTRTTWTQQVTFFEGLICWSYRKRVHHICNSRKQLPVKGLLTQEIKVFQKLLFKVSNVPYNFSSVDTSYTYFNCFLNDIDSQTKHDIFIGKY